MNIDAKQRRLYRQTILDRAKSPRHYGITEPIDRIEELENPYCGDRIKITMVIDRNNKIADLKFTGAGCALCLASADLTLEIIKGKTLERAIEIIEHLERVMLGEVELDSDYDRLKVIEGVKRYPIKIKCVSLPWQTIKKAISSRSIFS